MLSSVYRLFVESAARAALLQRLWGVASGPITAFLILTYIGPIDQGYYFAFLSLGSIVMFFELGFGQIIVQSITHATAGQLEMPSTAVAARLAGGEGGIVVDIARRWYGGAGLVFAITAFFSGWWWFDQRGNASGGSWLLAWALYIAGMAVNLALGGTVAVVEGLGEVVLVYKLRLFASVSGAFALWGTVMAGGGYYGLAAQQLLQFAVTAWYVAPIWRALRRLPPMPMAKLGFFWRQRLLPLQWRSAIVVASSFFIFQATTLIAFRVLGPVEGGKIGFTMTIGTMLASLVILAVSVNAVKLGNLAANGQWEEFDRQFRLYVWVGVLAGLVAAVAVDGMLWVAVRLHLIDGMRLLPQAWLWCVFLASLVAALVQAVTIRMRCLRQEPFALQNFMAAVIWPLAGVILGRHFGLGGLAVGYLVLVVFGLALPVYFKFCAHERSWRAP